MGKPVVHWEFWSKDPAKVSEFYSKAFDWKVRNDLKTEYRVAARKRITR